VSLLDRKLMRDLSALRGQIITIALVVAAGVAVFVASISTFYSLLAACDRFYIDARFPQIFVTLKRAPLSIVARLNKVPGVVAVEPRIVRDVIVDWLASSVPVSARLVSIARAGDETLARLYMRAGVAPATHDVHDAAINEAFADGHDIRPGADLRVLLNGRMQTFRISGIALSAEYVYTVKPGLPVPDDRLYAILWVDRDAVEAAFDMKGAFNDAAISLAPGTDPKPVIAELDRLLEPYGSVGAIERRDIRPMPGRPRHEPIIRRTSLTVSDFVTGDASGQAQPVQIIFSILADPPMLCARNHNWRNRSQALDHLSRFFETL